MIYENVTESHPLITSENHRGIFRSGSWDFWRLLPTWNPGFAAVTPSRGSLRNDIRATRTHSQASSQSQPASQPAGHGTVLGSDFYSLSLFLCFYIYLSLFLPCSLFFSLSFPLISQAGRPLRKTNTQATECVCVGAVPSSVVVLSAGWQRGWCTRRKRGPRGTRWRTPRWFHAVKAVRFLQ